MTARPSYDVDPDQLRAHASRLAAHADQLSSIGTALPGEMRTQALGSFAEFITAGLGAAMTETAGALAHSASTLDKVANGMRRAADLYQNSDEDYATGLTALGSNLEEGDR